MYANLRDYENGAVLDTDICIMGAGAAGITMAREFARANREALLIESGDFEPEEETLALNEGKVVGEYYPPLQTARLRYFGGTTNHWGGNCRPFDPIDFEKRDWVPYSGWPITRSDLESFYIRATEVVEVEPYEFDAETWRPGLKGLLEYDRTKFADRLWHYSPPTRFGERYREDLDRAKSVRVLLNANVVDVVLNDAASAVIGFKLKALGGKEATVRARTYVLAGGGIENPRVMLMSDGVMPMGIGNGNDLVGRFFQEHACPLLAYGVPPPDLECFRPYYQGTRTRIDIGEAVLRIHLGPTEALQRERRLRSGTIAMGFGNHRAKGFLAFREARQAVRERDLGQLGESLLTMARDLDGLVEGMYFRLTDKQAVWFTSNVEQEPNPLSRVTLDRERDALGCPQAVLDWRLTAGDKAAVRTIMRLLAEELSRSRIARVRIDDWLLDESLEWKDLVGEYHHIGTTRMSDDPKSGVVDRDCKVNGIANLYVAGSSVFSTSGYANPTMTIVALALRLADHLNSSTSLRAEEAKAQVK